jgi:hypothetical protein
MRTLEEGPRYLEKASEIVARTSSGRKAVVGIEGHRFASWRRRDVM